MDAVKRDVQETDEEAVRVKEQSILELGGLLAKTGQAAGKLNSQQLFAELNLIGPEYTNYIVTKFFFW